MLGTLKTLGTERLEVKIELILWPNIVESLAMRILWGCDADSSWENKDEWGVMWLQQTESISQEEGDIPDETKREEE